MFPGLLKWLSHGKPTLAFSPIGEIPHSEQVKKDSPLLQPTEWDEIEQSFKALNDVSVLYVVLNCTFHLDDTHFNYSKEN